MTNGLKSAVVLALTVAYVKGHLAWKNADLHPVQGLYVKPSSDGTTGDLYVAATEESGVNSQWLTDQPINFLPTSSQPQPSMLPLLSNSLLTNALPQDESIIATQKRAVITDPAKYSYALQYGTPGANYMPYAYAGIQQAKSESLPSNEVSSQAEAVPTPAAVSQYSPYHYMYPHMMHAAYASAMKVLKESGAGSEDASNSNAITSYPTAYWPAPYYPMQYVMMDTAAWAKSHAAAISSSTTSAPTSEPTTENTNES